MSLNGICINLQGRSLWLRSILSQKKFIPNPANSFLLEWWSPFEKIDRTFCLECSLFVRYPFTSCVQILFFFFTSAIFTFYTKCSTLNKNFSRWHFEIFFLFFLENWFDILCKLSPMETICIKCQILFSGENTWKKKMSQFITCRISQESGKG